MTFPTSHPHIMGPSESAVLSNRLHTAVADEDWTSVVELLELEWPVLLAIASPALDAALHALPVERWSASLIVSAVRELRLNVRGDTTELDRIAARAALPSQPAEAREIARTERARPAMSAGGALMLAYRLHGQYRKALYFAGIVEEIARRARVSQPAETAIRVPSALLQIGITRLLAGEYHRASVLLREAYELRHETWDGRVGGDAAGKLALLYAVRGETVEAEKWLSRHDDGELAMGWMVPLVQLSAQVAAVLIAIDRLDREAAEAGLKDLELQVNRERSWAPFVTFAHARYGLIWGDQRAALQRIERTRAFTGEAHRHAGIEPRLDAVKANLLLALNRPAEAQAVLAEREGDPHSVSVAARLALMSGQKATALEVGASGLSMTDVDPRGMVDLLITSALAEDRADSGRRYLQQAISTAARTRAVVPFIMAHRPSLMSLMSTLRPDADLHRVEEVLSSAPEPMPEKVALIELTSMEQRVLRFLVDGESRPKIAQALFVSENTVKFHIRNVYRKLGVASRAEAVAKAHHLRLVSAPRS